MTPEQTTALQALLNAQFQAGRALGLFEAALAAEPLVSTPKPSPSDLAADLEKRIAEVEQSFSPDSTNE